MELNTGCTFGQVQKQRFDDYEKRIDSKIEDCQTTSKIMLNIARKNKETLSETQAISSQAIDTAKKLEKEWKGLWGKIFWGVILGNGTSATIVTGIYVLIWKIILKH